MRVLSLSLPQMATMDYAEIRVDQKYHRHIIGKGGASGKQGFIHNFSVGVGKMMHVELRPLGGCGGMLLQEIFEIYIYSDVVSGAPKRLEISY